MTADVALPIGGPFEHRQPHRPAHRALHGLVETKPDHRTASWATDTIALPQALAVPVIGQPLALAARSIETLHTLPPSLAKPLRPPSSPAPAPPSSTSGPNPARRRVRRGSGRSKPPAVEAPRSPFQNQSSVFTIIECADFSWISIGAPASFPTRHLTVSERPRVGPVGVQGDGTGTLSQPLEQLSRHVLLPSCTKHLPPAGEPRVSVHEVTPRLAVEGFPGSCVVLFADIGQYAACIDPYPGWWRTLCTSP